MHAILPRIARPPRHYLQELEAGKRGLRPWISSLGCNCTSVCEISHQNTISALLRAHHSPCKRRSSENRLRRRRGYGMVIRVTTLVLIGAQHGYCDSRLSPLIPYQARYATPFPVTQSQIGAKTGRKKGGAKRRDSLVQLHGGWVTVSPG